MRAALSAALLLLAGATDTPRSPIVSRFAADPSPHVFGGAIYVYATDDQSNSGKYWDSTGWRLFTSRDLKRWTDAGEVAKASLFAWAPAGAKAWAPDVAYRDGRYFLYAPVGGDRIGVAVSQTPAGPFRDALGQPLIDKARDANAGAEPIAPTAFVDRDGQAYLVFGTRVPKIIRLTRDMTHLAGPITDLTVTGLDDWKQGRAYGEAPFLHRHGETYYFTFSTGWPGRIAYATAPRVTGPYAYRGYILDYRKISTNHHGVLEMRGKSYLFFHDALLPGSGNYRRAITFAPMRYRRDGAIEEVVSPPPN